MICLIDADIISFRIAVVQQNNEAQLYAELDRYMLETLVATRATHYGAYVSGRFNFRKRIAHDYKAHRSGKPLPPLLTEAKNYLIENWGAYACDGMEADDAISIGANTIRRGKRKLPYVIATIDKDLNQVPGMHYNFVKKEFFNVTPLEAQTAFFEQMLAGDRTDNIRGLPDKTQNLKTLFGLNNRAGVGAKTAQEIIAQIKPNERMKVVPQLYIDYFGNKGMKIFVETYACVRMLTEAPPGFHFKSTLSSFNKARNTNPYVLLDRTDRKQLGYNVERRNS